MSSPAFQTLHDAADARGEHHYVDPDTGYRVFTATGLRSRGECCGSGCRHCPFDHAQVALERRSLVAKQPAWLSSTPVPDEPVDLLFWSSGKDSYLSWRALQREAQRPVVLLTTFDVHSRKIAHQDVSIDCVVRQAEHLKLPLLGVPLYSEADYVEQIHRATELIPNIARLVFGDLHLEHIRDWREDAFSELATTRNAELYYPLWQVPYADLMDDLEASGIVCEVSAVTENGEPWLTPGQRYNRAVADALPASVDRFGECGEFHTLARVWEQA